MNSCPLFLHLTRSCFRRLPQLNRRLDGHCQHLPADMRDHIRARRIEQVCRPPRPILTLTLTPLLPSALKQQLGLLPPVEPPRAPCRNKRLPSVFQLLPYDYGLSRACLGKCSALLSMRSTRTEKHGRGLFPHRPRIERSLYRLLSATATSSSRPQRSHAHQRSSRLGYA